MHTFRKELEGVYYDAAAQKFIPVAEKLYELDIWKTEDPYIQVMINSADGSVAIDRALICTVHVDDTWAVLTSGKFYDLLEKIQKVLLTRAYMQYIYTQQKGQRKSETGATIKAENGTILSTSKDAELRINAYLYMVFGKKTVDVAVKSAAVTAPLKNLAIREYKTVQKTNRKLVGEIAKAKILGFFMPVPESAE